MNYHDIQKDDMLNGSGIRVSLFVSGCDRHCEKCQNPQTWNKDSGIEFTNDTYEELKEELKKDYVSGITFTGGHPLEYYNYSTIYTLCFNIKREFPNKSIWIYTGFNFEDIKDLDIMKYVDVIVDGKYIDELRDVTLAFRGSSNQRIIDVQASLRKNKTVILNYDN